MARNILSRAARGQDAGARPLVMDHTSEAVKRATEAASAWVVAEDPAAKLIAQLRQMVTAQGARLRDNVFFMSAYANTDFMSQFYQGTRQPVDQQDRMADNQIKKHTDTLAGKLIQANSRVVIMTSDGDWSTWRKARKLENAIAGEWSRMKFFREAQKVAVDGLNTGTGVLKLVISDSGKSIDCMRVYPNEVFVDDAEAMGGEPRKMYQARYVARDTLMALYPDKAEVVQRATNAQPPQVPWTLYAPNMVEVVEGWSLPVGTRPGRHVMATSGGTLIDEDWDEQMFPFVIFKPFDMPMGWYGQGLTVHAVGAQQLLNQTLETMQKGAELAIAPYWVVPEGSNINLRHLDNMPGHIIETAGGEPKWVTNPPFHQAAPVYCDMLRQQIADMYGNNQMDTGGDPSGQVRLDSKRALKEFQNMGAARITTILTRWSEDFFLDAAERTRMYAARIAKAHGTYPVLAREGLKRAIALDWKDLVLSEEDNLMQPAPANMFSQNPSARLDQLTEMMQAGLISAKQAQRQMQGPRDVTALLAEATATEEDIDELIEGFVERGNYRAPNSLQDLNRGLARVADAWLLYRMRGLPEERLALFEQWLDNAQALITQMNSQGTPQGGPDAAGQTTIGGSPTAGDLAGGPAGPAGPAAGGLPGAVPAPIAQPGAQPAGPPGGAPPGL